MQTGNEGGEATSTAPAPQATSPANTEAPDGIDFNDPLGHVSKKQNADEPSPATSQEGSPSDADAPTDGQPASQEGDAPSESPDDAAADQADDDGKEATSSEADANAGEADDEFRLTPEQAKALGFQADGDDLWFYVDPDDPEGTRYRDLGEARKGIYHKDRLIRDQESKLSQLSEAKSELDSTVQQLQNRIAFLEKNVPETQAAELFVKEFISQKHPDLIKEDGTLMKPDEVVGDPDKFDKLTEAIGEAKAEMRQQQAKQLEQIEKAQEEHNARTEAAHEFYVNALIPEKLGLRNTEEKHAFGRKLTEDSGAGVNHARMIFFLAQTAGEKVAQRYINDLVRDFKESGHPSFKGGQLLEETSTESKAQPNAPAPPAKSDPPEFGSRLRRGVAAQRRAGNV